MDKEKDKKNGAKNDAGEDGNGKKSLPERNKRGQFVNSPGPGRPKKEKPVELDGELLGMIEQVVKTGLNADELKDRLKAAGIGIRIQSMKKSDDTDVDTNSFITRWLGFVWGIATARSNETRIPTSGLDVLKRMCEVCVNCDRLGTEGDNWLEEVKAEDDL
jgi:hypothetical protein